MESKNRDSNSSTNVFVSYGDVFNDDDENSLHKRNAREKLHHYLNRIWVHTVIVITVLLQLLFITSLLLIHYDVIQDPPASNSRGRDLGNNTNGSQNEEPESIATKSKAKEAEDALSVINVVIFILFLIEICLRIVAKGFSITQDRLQVFDCVVVAVVCVLYISLLAAGSDKGATYSIAYLIILRLWRIGRIYHDITEGERRKAERVVNAHRKAAKDAEHYARTLIVKVEQQQHEITSLRQHVKSQRNLTSSPATRTESHNAVSPDDPGTSEDEFDHYEKHTTKQVLEMVTVELSEGNSRTPNGSVPSGTPNGSVPNMTPSSSCSYLTGDGPDADKISNKFPDLVEQAQGLETKDFSGEGESDKLRTSKGHDVEKTVADDISSAVNFKNQPWQHTDSQLEEQLPPADGNTFAYSNVAFQPDSESQDPSQTLTQEPSSMQSAQPSTGSSLHKIMAAKGDLKSKADDFGSTTYLQDGIPMTDL